MSDQVLRDKHNKVIGTIKQKSDGRLEIRDVRNKVCGTYDPKTDTTRDAHNAVAGKGNLLATLLPRE